MKWGFLLLMSLFAGPGCTTLSLQYHTFAQSNSVSDLRYREVLENLAMVANDPAALPAYSSIFAGTAQVTSTAQFGSTTVWSAKGLMGALAHGFSMQAIVPQFSRIVSENWSLDPVIPPEKLEAMRCACQWVLYGPEQACASCPGLLASPEQDPSPGRHFGVADRLGRLPPGWLRVGRLRDVPAGACYRAHCGKTWVWVMPDGMQGLSDFTLVLQDIAQVSINSDSLYYWPPPPCVYTRISGPACSAAKATGNNQGGAGKGPKGKPDPDPRTLEVACYTDGLGHLVPALPYRGVRFENAGSDPSFRSVISASTAP